MNRSLIRLTAQLQLGITLLIACGCAPTQPFFLNESPDLNYYLNSATQIEYPDVDVESLPETTEALPPLAIGNHDYQFWDLTLEEATNIALQNAKFFVTTSGIAETRQNVADQFISSTFEQVGSIYDVAIQQSTTQSVPLTVDSNGNRTLPRGVLRANQVGGVEDALAEFDAQASGFISYSNTDRPRNSGNSAVSTSLFQSDDVTAQAAISKRFATGGVATLRHQLVYGHNNLPTAPLAANSASRVVSSDYTVSMEAQVQQPLMRNRGTLVNRIPVVLASLNEDVSIAEYEVQVRNLVRDVENAYWDLYVAYRNVATSVVGRNSAIATAQFAQLALENGTGTLQELSQAKGQYFQFKAQLETALAGSNLPGPDRFGVYGSENRLRELMGLAATDGRLIRPIDEPTLARVEFDWNESVAQMLYLSPELRRTKTRIKQQELELISAKNQILPEVNLSLLYRWVGVGDTLGPPDGGTGEFPEPGSSALGSFTGGDFQEGAVRLEVTPPAIGSRRELARIQGSKFRLAAARSKLQEDERLMVSKLSDAIRKAQSHYQLTQTNAQQWQAFETEVETRLAEFEAGTRDINVVLQSQQRKAQAEINYYRALAEYSKSLSYVDYLKGTLLANSGIVLREGPWNKKAYWDALERARERSAGKKLQYGVTRPGVVRQGPVREADSASQIIGSGANTHGQILPPGEFEMNAADGQVIFGDANGEALPMDMGIVRDPIRIDDHQPLSEYGSSTHEMLQAPQPIDRLSPPVTVPTPAPSIESAQPLRSPAASSNDGASWGTARRVQPAAYTAPAATSAAEPAEYAPQPVRRKPIPR